MATKSIGYVAELIGDAQVRSMDGVIRVLSIGDQIYEGDILTTGLNTQIVLEFYNGNKLQVGENTEMLLDESVFAGLGNYPDSRVDQLAELQSLIVEGVDLAELEATAAGAASDSDALHQASVYSRIGDEGIVETRLTPFNLGSPGPDNQSPLGDGAVTTPATDTPTVSAPTASIAVQNITADDIINATEMAGMINVTGTVSGIAKMGDSIDLNVNGTAYSGTVTATNTFSVPVAAADLMADTNFNATVSGLDAAGNPYSATTTSSHTVDTTAIASITLDANITPDDIIDAVEAAGMVSITGTVAGDFQAGDIVTLTVNGVSTSGAVLADGSFSIDVNGSDLRNDPDSTIDASFIATDAAGNVAGPVTDTETYSVNTAPDAIDDVGALDSAEDTTTANLNATLLANDSDPDGDPISITAINGIALVGGVQSIVVANGTVNIDASDNITFTPDANYNGPVSFNYTLSDGSLTSTATVSGTIIPVNDNATVSASSGAVTEDDAATLTTSGTVTITDVDAGEAFAIPQASTAGTYGTFSVDAAGNWSYQADNTQTAIQELGATDTLTETFTVTSQNGSASNTVTVTINGTNDVATVSASSGSVTEDDAATLTTSGSVTITDTDAGEAFAIPQASTAGTYGTFSVDAAGNWSYLADNTQAAIQQLGATDTLTETFTVTSQDGSASNTVTVTINGTNDTATVSASSGAVTEDDAATLTTSGSVTITDVDAGEAFAIPQASTAGTYGTFSVDAAGNWSYQADNTQTAIQELGATDTLTETFTVTSQDGSASNTVTVTINGTNDAATVSSATVDLTETDSPVSTSGTLTSIDIDNPDNTFIPSSTVGAIGSFSIDAVGNWTFTANSAFDNLNVGDNVNETFNVASIDGTPSTVQITINGTNDGPVIDLDANDSAATGNDYAATFTEGGSAVYIADTDINITDVDDTNLVSATITINSVEAGDLLTVGSIPAGIVASAYNAATGTITLSGSASMADYQTAIRAIQFSNDGSTTNTSRSINVVVNDGLNNSNTATTDVAIVTLPTVSVTDVSVQEPAAGTTTLTFTISIDQTLGSDLTFDYETANISALAGADYVGISSTVGTITAGSTSTTVTVTVNSDADVFEGDETLSLDLTNFNQTVNFDTAAHTISGGVQGIGTIGANNGPPVAVDDSYITTVDTPLVVTNALANDTLVDNAVVDVTGYTDLGSGVYSFAGTNGTVVYDSNDGSFTFTPDLGYTGTASFDYTLIDDDGETDTATISVDVSSVVVNPPVVSNVPETAYTENDSPVSLIAGVNITDVDSTNLSSVVVTIDGYIGSQDVINYLTAGTSVVANVSVSGSTWELTLTAWELTLTGGVDINEYETVLESITYQNSSENPSTSVRDITIEAFDQSYANLFGSDAGTLSITAVNDAPDVYNNSVFVLDGSSDNALNITVPTDPDTDDNLLVITITGLPSTLGTVTLADGTPVSVGATLTLAELAGLEFDAGVTQGQGTLTYDVFDGSLTTPATTTINVGSTEADIGTVYESALINGTGVGGGSDTVTGNLFANDAASTPTSTIDDVNGTTPTGGVITINTAIGTLTVYADNTTPGFSAVDYVYVLNSADGSSNDIDEVFTYTFTEGVALSDTLTISIIDDAPVANDVVQDVPESEEKIFNIIFTLDDSGSMGWGADTGNNPPDPGEQTRMEIAQEALSALGGEYFNQSTQVEITLITFNSNASFVGTYSDFASFEAALNAVTPGGGTNYVDATDEIQTQLTTDLAGQNPADDVQNISYFISDGEANAGTSPIGSGYIEFVNSNSVDSYSVGIGSSLPGDLSDLNYIHNIDSLGQGAAAPLTMH